MTSRLPGTGQGMWPVILATVAAFSFAVTSAQDTDLLESAVLSDDSAQPYYFTIPAPRGQILDRHGKPLARTVAVRRLMLRVPNLDKETPESFVEWVDLHWAEIAAAYPGVVRPDVETLKQHFEHRRRLPMAISSALREDSPEVKKTGPEGVELQTEYARDYPGGTRAAHVLGYVTPAGAPLKGPLLYGEPLWRPVEGREGLEASMNAELSGRPGLLLVCYNKKGEMVRRHVMTPPAAGRDVVTTLDLEMQAAAEKALASAKRPGAMVIVDASTGNVLAMASGPTFDPNAFATGLDKDSFDKIKGDGNQPLFHRAVGALYPPGSVFKPFVAIAGMREGRLNPALRVPCGPELTIEGRKFRNWSDNDRGWFDLNSAIVRSCNTYFYQAGIATGDQPILETAREFGFGEKISLPLAGVAGGSVPDRVPNAQGQANLSIGQSPILSTPLEVAMAMAALSNGERRPRARLVAQVQDQRGAVVSAIPPAWDGDVHVPADQLAVIHNAMYGVVNHRDGTGARARVKTMPVYGKTGTAQWSREGEMVNAVWFAGFVKDTEPPLAFAITLEGSKGEKLFGGSAAAPLAGQVLAGIASAPKTYSVRIPKMTVPLQDYALGNQSLAPVPEWAMTLREPLLGGNGAYGYDITAVAASPVSGAAGGYPPGYMPPTYSGAMVAGNGYSQPGYARAGDGASPYSQTGRMQADSARVSVSPYSRPAVTPSPYSTPAAQPGYGAPAQGRPVAMANSPTRRMVITVPASDLPGAAYTPPSIYTPPVPKAVPYEESREPVRQVQAALPGYPLRYESPPPQRRVRKLFSFPIH